MLLVVLINLLKFAGTAGGWVIFLTNVLHYTHQIKSNYDHSV